jgi:hypothetical protein
MGAPTATATRGSGGGTAFADACPTGYGLLGYIGSLDAANLHARLRGACIRYEVIGPVASPRGVWMDPTLIQTTNRGMGGVMTWNRLCSPGSLVVGFEGRSGSSLDQLTVHCGVLTPASDGTIALGTTAPLGAVGGTGGTAFPLTSCAANTFATEARGQEGVLIDGVGLGCSLLTW